MRKIKLFICGLLLSLFISNTALAYSPTDIQYTRFGDSIIMVEDANNLQPIDVDMMEYVSNVTPYEIRELFAQESVNVCLTHSISFSERTDSSTGDFFNGICYASTVYYNTATRKVNKVSSPVTIYIYSNTERADVYIHECGHALDNIAEYITGYYSEKPISNSTEWQTLYTQNAAVLATFDNASAYNVPRSACEGFAEAYRLYFVYPQKLQATCPSVYNFVATQISKYTAYLRPVTYDNFNYIQYCVENQDIYNLYGLDKDAAWNHYINYGKAEGRKASRIVK